MSMRLRIKHTTGFSYEGSATASYNEVRLTPITTPDQVVIDSRLAISPRPWSYTYWDYWGTQVTSFEVHDPHEELTVTATSTLDVHRSPGDPAGMTWAQLQDRALAEQHWEYLEASPRVRPGSDLMERAQAIVEGGATPSDAAAAVCELVHKEVEYVVGATGVHTLAEDAWADRKGVCQDMAHLVIGTLRSLGIPARYVSGYLHPDPDPQLGEAVVGESHAWIEWWDGEWVGFDPTNSTHPGDRYVVVARGRDYSDVAPLTGVFSGGQTSSMFVQVEVTRVR